MTMVYMAVFVGNSTTELINFRYEGEGTAFETQAKTVSFVRQVLGMPYPESDLAPICIFSLRNGSFLDAVGSLSARGVKGEDVLILTDQNDPELIQAIARVKGWDKKVTRWSNLNWPAALIALMESIPIVGKGLAALFKKQTDATK